MVVPVVNPDADLLGEIVTWDMPTGDYAVDAIVDSLDGAGLEVGIVSEMRITNAFGRATKHLKENRAIDRLAKKTKSSAVQYQFTHKRVDATKVDYSYECCLELDAETGEVTCGENEELADRAQQLTAFARQTRTAQDVSRLVQKLFQSHADLYPINKKKGVAYFVPEQHRGFTAKVQEFLGQLGGVMERFPVPKGTPEGNMSVANAINSGMESLLSELDTAMSEWTEETRAETMDRAAQRLEAVQYKVTAYASYLETKQEELEGRLAKMREDMVRKMMDLGKLEVSQAE